MHEARRLVRAVGLLAVFYGLALLASVPAHAQAPEIKVLVFHGAGDPTTDAGVAAIEGLGSAHGVTVVDTADSSAFTADNLATYRAGVFLNTPGDRLSTMQEAALEQYVRGGGGFVGIGSAAEVEPGIPFFDGLIGARPAAASPTTPGEAVVEAGDRVHPATRDLPLEWTRSDVWYQWTTRPTGTVHTVARVRATGAPAGDGTDVANTDTPIAWCRDYLGGRSFYTGMGRTEASYGEDAFKGHLLGAIQWADGTVRAGCKATIASNYKATRVVSGGAVTTGLQ